MLDNETLKNWEKNILIIKRHYFANIILLMYGLLFFIISIILLMIFWFNQILNIFLIICWISLALFIYLEWLKNELWILIITNKRIISFEKQNLLNKKMVEFNLIDIKEVSTNSKWLFGNMMHFWNINIHSLPNKTMTMKYAPNNIENAKKILKIIKEHK